MLALLMSQLNGLGWVWVGRDGALVVPTVSGVVFGGAE